MTRILLIASLSTLALACEPEPVEDVGPCPELAPSPGAPCVEHDLQCTYVTEGTDGLACDDRQTFVCNGTQWLDWDDPHCSTGAACPADPEGTACSGETCAYPDGRVCVCVACLPGGSDGGPCDRSPTLRCAAPPTTAGCPSGLPVYGAACEEEGLRCAWGDSLSFCSIWPTVVCRDGRWQPEGGGCP